MTDPTTEPPRPSTTGPIPGERRLAHPPSDRYGTSEPAPPTEDPAASAARGVAFGVVAAATGSVLVTVLGGVLAVSSGLLVVAGATGWAVSAGLRAGAGGQIAADRRVRLALGLVFLSVALGQLGLWLYARTEGGVLGPLDYLGEVFGLLVPFELLVAWIVAWVTAR